MAIKILFDANNRPIEPTLLLANKNGNILGLITNVSELRVTDNLTSVSRMSFKVTKYYDNQKCNVWDDLVDFKLVYCIEWDTWFEATLSLNESNEIIKIVDCAALSEAELSQTNLYGYEINTESDIAREDYKNPTIIYNPEDHSSSLIHRILTKAPHYTIKHIDATLARIQRTFSFDSISILDAFNRIAEEIGCIFIYGNESVKENGMRHPARTVSLYDLQQNCNDCGYRGEFTDVCPVCGSKNIKYGYGKDTTIFVNRDNLTDSIDFSVDTDSVKNCFRLEAGDDLMTATIINCNPNGTQYMWYISDAVKADMPKTLVDRINRYDKEYQFFNEKYQMNLSLSAINDYNRLVDKYLIYDSSIKKVPTSIVGYPSLMQSVYDVIDFEIILSESLMPKISMDKVTAQGQADLLTAASLSPVAVTNIKALSKTSADSNILAVAKIIVDSRYRVKIKESSFDTDSKVWVGNFSVTSYSDETDTAISQTISIAITDDYEQYVKQKLDKALKKGDTTDYSISGIFKRDIIISGTNYGGDFVTTLQKYSLSMLEIIHDCCRGCIDVLIEQGISDRSKQSIETGNLYDKFYHNYYHRLKAIEKEMSVRQSEIDTIHTLMNEIEKERTKIQSQLNFQDYLGDENWKIFSSYRREDKYSNHNFISDGLNNTQLFNNALDFLGKAQEELYKSATLQHIISAPLKNLLVIKEFSPLVDYFEVGNWIRIEVDGEIFKLRLLNYSIDFDNLENIDVEFSDVCSTRSGISDLSSLYKKMTSISTSYDYYEKQAEKGSSSYETLNDFYLKGLDATLVKLVNNADDQDVVFDRHGMLFRQKDDVTNDFLPTQLKIVNSTLAVTNDNWETAKTGVGKFIYFDPRDFKYKEGFGIIADTLVGDVILSSEVGIFNDECSIALDKNGFTLTTNTIGKNVFTIQKETVDAKGNKIYDRQLYINDNGDIVLGGDASISWENITGTNHIVTDADIEKLKQNINDTFKQEINILLKQSDLKAETWYQPTDPSLKWTTPEEKEKHSGDLWYNTETEKSYIYKSETESWEELKTNPPSEVFDKIDGKAQIFVSQPKPPYNIGDLWFDSKSSDIMTCVSKRDTGEYVASDWEKRNKYTDNSELFDFVENVYRKNIDELQAQIDGQIETFYYDYEPSLQNIPASNWITQEDRQKHLGDLFYWKSKGYAYRFLQDGATWKWQLVQDTDITAALQKAEHAQDTADGKRRVFVVQPQPPYDIGDLWTQGTSGDLMRCKVAKSIGTFDIADWEKATKYTDNSQLIDFIENTYKDDKNYLYSQIDGKVETFIQPTDPSLKWTTPEEKEKHSGDLWYNTATNETFIYNGTDWGAMTGEIPQELWDTIDGKAQIFTTIPVPPYHVGDLWFGGVDKDIMTCVSTRLSGEYVDTDWERLNKYTDDSSVENVKHNLGYTYIDGKYVISPHIVGGDLTIGNVNGTYAKIDSNGILTAKGANISGTIYATDGEFSGKVVAKSGSFHGSVYATDGVFNGTVYATDGKFKGEVTATGGTFKGDVLADTMVAKNAYYIYTNDFTDNVPVYKNKIIMGEGIGGNMFNSVTFGLNLVENSSQELNKPYINFNSSNSMHSDISIQSNVVNINSSVNIYNGLDVAGGSFFAQNFSDQNIIPSKCMRWGNNTSFPFDHQGYGHTHTIIANSGGTKAIAIGDGVNAPVAGDEEWCILPYNITATKDSYSGQSEIATIGRDRSGTMNIGYDGYRFNCLYIKSINLNGDERSAWPSGGSSGTSNYNNLTNKPSINGNVLTGNNTSDDLGLASKSHSHSNYLTSSSLSGYATTSQLGNYYTKSETYTKSEVNNLVQNSGGSSSAPSLVTVSDGGVRPPISTGTGATQKVAYITANDTKKLTVKAQFGSTGYTNMNVALATSDQRLKCNIKESQISGLDAINAIKLREFDWVQTGKHQEIGVIADELEIIDKNLTFGGGYDEYGDMNIKGVDSFYLQGYEIKAIQELSQINEIQEKEVQELKNMILQLQGEISILKQKAIP